MRLSCWLCLIVIVNNLHQWESRHTTYNWIKVRKNCLQKCTLCIKGIVAYGLQQLPRFNNFWMVRWAIGLCMMLRYWCLDEYGAQMTASVSVLLVFVPGPLSVFTQTVHICVYVCMWLYINPCVCMCVCLCVSFCLSVPVCVTVCLCAWVWLYCIYV